MHESTAGGRLRAVPAAAPRQPIGLFVVRVAHVNLGLALFGFSLACMLRADVGLGPWDVFHQGLALRTPLTVGQGMIVTGLALIVFAALVARIRPGLGTLLNMLLVGLWVDVFMAASWLPSPNSWPVGAMMFAVGIVLNGAATGLYLSAGLGAGPRDGFAIGLARVIGTTVARARTLVEVVVVSAGWLLGGSVGVGTIVFALTIGPIMQAGLRSCEPLVRAYARVTRASGSRVERLPAGVGAAATTSAAAPGGEAPELRSR